MNNHTPGPWVAKFEEAYYVIGPDLGRVAMMMNLKGAHGLAGRRSGEESAANARLIAAAPETAAERDRLKEINAELLAALEKLYDACAPYEHLDVVVGDACDTATAVMTKASGYTKQKKSNQ